MGKLHSIQSLRAIAALLVFLCHLFAMEEVHAGRSEKLTSIWVNGAHGVDLFFVISGFVIVWVASDARPGWRGALDFLYARIARIYPLWWLFAGATAIMLWIARGAPWNPERMADHGMDGPTHLIESLLLLPQAHHPVLGVGWTLVHEMYFYAAFAILILILPARRRLTGLLVWSAIVLIGASAGLTNVLATTFVELIFYPMTLQFTAGAIVAYLIKANYRRFARACFVLGVAGWIAIYLDFDRSAASTLVVWFDMAETETISIFWDRTVRYGIPAALLVYGLVAMELQAKTRASWQNPLVRVGDWSYALYLCHVPVISVTRKLIYDPFGADQLWSVSAYLVFATIATFTVAGVTYHVFERRVIAFFKRYRWQRGRQNDLSVPAPAV